MQRVLGVFGHGHVVSLFGFCFASRATLHLDDLVGFVDDAALLAALLELVDESMPSTTSPQTVYLPFRNEHPRSR